MVEEKDRSELEALISMLDEPVESSFMTIRDKVYSYGMDVVPLLEEAWENAGDDRVQERIEVLIHDLQLDKLYKSLSEWALDPQPDLFKGFVQFSLYHYPNTDVKEITNTFNQIKKDIWLELNDNLTALEKVKVINHVFYQTYNFRYPVREGGNPAYLTINSLMNLRVGYPQGLALLYSALAQAVELPIHVVILPENRFYLAWMSQTEGEDMWRPKFYINPVDKGSVFIRRDLDALITRLKLPNDPKLFLPLPAARIIYEMLSMLARLYNANGELTKSRDAEFLMNAVFK